MLRSLNMQRRIPIGSKFGAFDISAATTQAITERQAFKICALKADNLAGFGLVADIEPFIFTLYYSQAIPSRSRSRADV